ncbi:MAG: trehalose-6-phosphate synthase, partial [Oleibacter sp.]|nr:trehalose-6-phosphate synthase [Thalassolituus sp.]
ATQGKTGGKGTLVLSEFAGAAAEVKGAILCNPHDPAEMAEKCYFALCIHPEDAAARLNEAYDVVSYYDIEYWGREFLLAVANSAEKNGRSAAQLTSVA